MVPIHGLRNIIKSINICCMHVIGQHVYDVPKGFLKPLYCCLQGLVDIL